MTQVAGQAWGVHPHGVPTRCRSAQQLRSVARTRIPRRSPPSPATVAPATVSTPVARRSDETRETTSWSARAVVGHHLRAAQVEVVAHALPLRHGHPAVAALQAGQADRPQDGPVQVGCVRQVPRDSVSEPAARSRSSRRGAPRRRPGSPRAAAGERRVLLPRARSQQQAAVRGGQVGQVPAVSTRSCEWSTAPLARRGAAPTAGQQGGHGHGQSAHAASLRARGGGARGRLACPVGGPPCP